MSFKQLFTSQEITVLAWLGKDNFFYFGPDQIPKVKIYDKAMLAKVRSFGKEFSNAFLKLLQMFIELDANRPEVTPFSLLHASKSFAAGERILQLSLETCDAISEKSLSFKMRDYEQPFETMIVQLPQHYNKLPKTQSQNLDPAFISLHHDRIQRILAISIPLIKGRRTAFLHTCDDTLCEELSNVANEALLLTSYAAIPEDQAREVNLMFRIAMNAMRCMTCKDHWRELPESPLQEKARKQLKLELRSSDKAIRKKAAIRNGTFTCYFELHQIVEAFSDPVHLNYEATWSEIEGTPKKPHFRKGFYRMQRVGPGRTQIRKTFIEPTMINEDMFDGDLRDTSTTYVSSKLPAR